MTSSALPTAPPLTRLKTITHIGTLNAEDKGNRGESHEGAGLSFSVHPEAWESIARLGGQSWWETHAKDLKILNGHTFIHRHKESLEEWGLENGWVTPGKAFVLSWTDGDTEEQMSMWCATRAEAEREMEDYEEGNGGYIEEIDTVLPTLALLKALKHSEHRVGEPRCDIHQNLATVWAESVGLDGVWWADTLDEDALSAPRGTLFAARLEGIAWKEVRTPSDDRRRRFRT